MEEQPAQEAPKPQRHIGLGRRTLIGGALLTAGLTGAANLSSADVPGVVGAVVDSEMDLVTGNDHTTAVEVDAGMQSIGFGGLELPGLKLSVTNSEKAVKDETKLVEHKVVETHSETILTPEQQLVESQNIDMEWARLFSADSNSETVTEPESITDIVARVKELREQGYSIRVELQGFASMEDDTADTQPELHNPGFGIPSEKNQRLADTREQAVEEIITPLLQEVEGEPIQIVRVPGLEIDDPSLAKDIIDYASSHDMDVVKLVKDFNRHPETLPADALQILKGLQDERVVNVSVIATKPAESHEVIVEETRTIIEQVDQQVETTKKDGGDIKIIPFVIPLIGLAGLRRKPAGKGPSGPIIIDEPPEEITVYPPPPPPPPPPPIRPPRPRLQEGPKDELFQTSEVKSGRTVQPRHRIQQPRNHNFSRGNYLTSTRGRMSRSRGGGRSGKRV